MERMAIRNNYLEREKKNAIVIIIDIKRTIYSFKFDKFSLRSRLRINIIERLIVVPYVSKNNAYHLYFFVRSVFLENYTMQSRDRCFEHAVSSTPLAASTNFFPTLSI